MTEYYSKEQLLERGRTTWCDMYDLEDFLGEFSAEDVLQITRCKDCKYWDINSRCNCKMHEDGDTLWDENDFCSYGTPQNDEARE